ncbi:MAG TPA: CrcB family protein [Mycobacteriales bacterium]|nr:CrcB family protein [Mycobacteriales bacterium]
MILGVEVAVTAGIGAVARYVVDLLVYHRTTGQFPLGTFVINTVGSLLAGLFAGLALHHGLPGTATVDLTAGFCAGFTTLSTWAYESLALVEAGASWEAGLNIVGSFAAGLAAAATGFGLALI